MGVKGLWRLINSSGTPVPLESLEQKILAIDVSIWLHQSVRGFKGLGDNVANAHLLTLFHRICKLLFYRIRPVFVFDGGVPHLKRQTLSSRRLKREVAAGKAQKVRERLLANLLKSQAVRKALGKKGPGPALHHIQKPIKKDKDMFELPPLQDEDLLVSFKKEKIENGDLLDKMKAPNLHNFELENQEFKSLSLDQQHEILTEIQNTRKENSWNNLDEMPAESNGFSSYQMERLLQRRKFQDTLDNVRSELRQIHTAELEMQLFGKLEKNVGQGESYSQKIVSEDGSHSLLIKKKKTEKNVRKEDLIKQQIKSIEESKSKSSSNAVKQDFLTELARQGIVSIRKQSLIEDDSWSNDGSSSDEDIEISLKKKTELDEAAFLKAMDYVLDSSELTQEEMLTIFNNSKNEPQNKMICNDNKVPVIDINQPSTSANAPGQIFQENSPSNNESLSTSSDDDDDFIDVTPTLDDNELSSTEPANVLSQNANLNTILKAKNDSLYLKIVQQRLDDVVQSSSSVNNSSTDSRKCSSYKSPNKTLETGHESTKKGFTISLNFDKQAISKEEDIFADIFQNKALTPLKQKNPEDLKLTTKTIKKKTPLDIVTNIENIDLTEDLESKFSQLIEEEVKKILSLSAIACEKENNMKAEYSKPNEVQTIPIDLDSDSSTDSTIGDVEELNADNNKVEFIQNSKLNIGQSLNQNVSIASASSSKEVTMIEKDIRPIDALSKNYIQNDVSHNNEDTIEEQDAIEIPLQYSQEDLLQMESELRVEENVLTSKVQGINRIAAELADHVYSDAQELLQLFGLPYLVAPMEAEAQCAFLEQIHLTHGTITDDSDIFLFGGNKVYKNFFNQTKHVEHFKLDNIYHHFGLDRKKMISLALLTGSDYTVGIESVGSVLGMEILSEFPGENIECLKSFKKWWDTAHKTPAFAYQSKTKQRLVSLYLPDSFPSENIINAYMDAEVDKSNEKFTWATPSIDKLEQFVCEKFGWSRSKALDILIPVFKKLGLTESQMRIDSYFTNIKLVKDDQFKSKRLQDAIMKSKDNLSGTSNENYIIPIEKKKKKTVLLLADPSEATYGPGTAPSSINKGKKRQSRKRKNLSSETVTSEFPSTDVVCSTSLDNSDLPVPSKMSKSDKKKVIYEKLLQKEKIMQREVDRKEMEMKKQLAATILKTKVDAKCKKH